MKRKLVSSKSGLVRAGALAVAVLAAGPAAVSWAGLAVPAFSSRPGAAYTLYLDFGGFSFNGAWGNSGKTPGVVPAYSIDGTTTAFSGTELTNIKEIWARCSERYINFNINVTTVDPAVAAGQAGTDTARQNYYDATAQVMHTMVGGSNAWYSPTAGGVSYLGVAAPVYGTTQGYKTNWVFPPNLGNSNKSISEAITHENGHALGLYHQADYSGETLLGNGYSTNNSASGNGSYAPTMGVTYSSQRGLWRVGNANAGSRIVQNDFATILANGNMQLLDDGIGHTVATATDLPVIGTTVDPSGARGFIAPASASSPQPIGVANYTKDYFRFFVTGGTVSLVQRDGNQFVTPGTADPGATLDGKLRIYNIGGTLVATSSAATDTLSESLSTSSLSPGVYYAEVASVGGYTSTFDTSAFYYTTGSYFLTGSNVYSRFNLNGVNYTGVNLTSQNMTSAALASAILVSANLASANLTSATMTSANLAGATLTGANLASANLTLADLRGATGYTAGAGTTVRGTILPNGDVAGFTFNAGETLRVRPNATAATSTGTIVGSAGGTGSIYVEPGGVMNLAPAASTLTNVKTLDGVFISLQGSAAQVATLRQSATTFTPGVSRTLKPEVGVISSLAVANDAAPLGSRAYYGLLDVGTNDLIVRNGSLADVSDLARAGLNASGATLFTGNGLTSSVAAADAAGALRYAVGVIPNVYAGSAIYSSFDGVTVSTADVLVKFTWYGDADLSGTVDDTDFFLANTGFLGGLTGWLNGDFDYSGIVDDTDFFLLNNGYLAQNTVLRDGGASVPEPSAMGLLVGATGLMLARRRR